MLLLFINVYFWAQLLVVVLYANFGFLFINGFEF